ncbi:MAG: hypothetical protein H6Q33_5329 [Deltaproteobacteria bacterium]|jgi:uncharacterized protein HemX|nr:hypothetical protein [Deltaproteobacteria bacterium]
MKTLPNLAAVSDAATQGALLIVVVLEVVLGIGIGGIAGFERKGCLVGG